MDSAPTSPIHVLPDPETPTTTTTTPTPANDIVTHAPPSTPSSPALPITPSPPLSPSPPDLDKENIPPPLPIRLPKSLPKPYAARPVIKKKSSPTSPRLRSPLQDITPHYVPLEDYPSWHLPPPSWHSRANSNYSLPLQPNPPSRSDRNTSTNSKSIRFSMR